MRQRAGVGDLPAPMNQILPSTLPHQSRLGSLRRHHNHLCFHPPHTAAMAAQTVAYSSLARAALPCSASRVARKSFIGAPLAQQQLVGPTAAACRPRSHASPFVGL